MYSWKIVEQLLSNHETDSNLNRAFSTRETQYFHPVSQLTQSLPLCLPLSFPIPFPSHLGPPTTTIRSPFPNAAAEPTNSNRTSETLVQSQSQYVGIFEDKDLTFNLPPPITIPTHPSYSSSHIATIPPQPKISTHHLLPPLPHDIITFPSKLKDRLTIST